MLPDKSAPHLLGRGACKLADQGSLHAPVRMGVAAEAQVVCLHKWVLVGLHAQHDWLADDRRFSWSTASICAFNVQREKQVPANMTVTCTGRLFSNTRYAHHGHECFLKAACKQPQ